MQCVVDSELLQVRNSGRMNKVEQDVSRVEEEVEGVREEQGKMGKQVEGVREEQERLGRVTAQQLREVTDTTGGRYTRGTLASRVEGS